MFWKKKRKKPTAQQETAPRPEGQVLEHPDPAERAPERAAKEAATPKDAPTAEQQEPARERVPTPPIVELTETREPAPALPVDPEERRRMIEEAAYFLAEARGFVPVDQAGDWAEAERQVDALLREERGDTD